VKQLDAGAVAGWSATVPALVASRLIAGSRVAAQYSLSLWRDEAWLAESGIVAGMSCGREDEASTAAR
jgi:hypothetical protein